MIDSFREALVFEYERLIAFLPRLLLAIIAALIIYTLGKWLAKGVIRFLKRSSIPETYHDYFGKLIKIIGAFAAFVIFLNLIGYQTLAASLLAGGGLTAVMLGFAFKDIGENFLAGFFLAFSRPFTTDDIIETDGILGQVKSIQLRHTHIRTGDGCDVFVPSAQLFTKPLHNYTLDGLRRGSFTVGIDYADDAQKAADLLLESTNETDGVLEIPKASVQIKGLEPNYVELQVFFWIRAKNQEASLAGVRTRAMNNCRKMLINHNFTVSSNVSTAVDMNPIEVLLQNREDTRKD
ncbi:mechanosensitive ion channel family protein [Rhodohalobacter sp. 614A]|uniref:mechanosensitive ion channel family protein n=1 Tax=Rhodohalobacter sp. 614A TaxID=2908649 RepID=UPI001F20E11A|nr:mechanosensitive ion channel family protein [Rhodohalobacter sp. 614A]